MGPAGRRWRPERGRLACREGKEDARDAGGVLLWQGSRSGRPARRFSLRARPPRQPASPASQPANAREKLKRQAQALAPFFLADVCLLSSQPHASAGVAASRGPDVHTTRARALLIAFCYLVSVNDLHSGRMPAPMVQIGSLTSALTGQEATQEGRTNPQQSLSIKGRVGRVETSATTLVLVHSPDQQQRTV